MGLQLRDGAAEGSAEMKNLLGGKGAGLAEMSNLGLPVPPGFTITTEVCTYFYDNDKTYPDELAGQVKRRSARSRRRSAPVSATTRIRSSSRSARGRAPRCRG